MRKDLCTLEANDGVVFQRESERASEIRKEANYNGISVIMIGLIDGARCRLQIDIGFGDAVTPALEEAEYPVLLDGPRTGSGTKLARDLAA